MVAHSLAVAFGPSQASQPTERGLPKRGVLNSPLPDLCSPSPHLLGGSMRPVVGRLAMPRFCLISCSLSLARLPVFVAKSQVWN